MLAAPDRDFFSLLSQATFANPFSADRERIDRKLAAAPRGEGGAEVLARLLARVRDRLQGLPTTNLRRYPAEERLLVEEAILFDVFHRVAGSFDALIQQQVANGGKSVPVPFGKETLASLARAGFGAADARRYFELFYQLRRAFYFIERTLPGASPSMRRLRERLWVGSSRVDLQACKLEYSIVSPK